MTNGARFGGRKDRDSHSLIPMLFIWLTTLSFGDRSKPLVSRKSKVTIFDYLFTPPTDKELSFFPLEMTYIKLPSNC